MIQKAALVLSNLIGFLLTVLIILGLLIVLIILGGGVAKAHVTHTVVQRHVFLPIIVIGLIDRGDHFISRVWHQVSVGARVGVRLGGVG